MGTIEVPQIAIIIPILILLAIGFGMILRVCKLNKAHQRKNKKDGKASAKEID